MQTIKFQKNSDITIPLLMSLPKKNDLLNILVDTSGSMMKLYLYCAAPLFDQLTDMVRVSNIKRVNILAFDNQLVFCNRYTRQEFIDNTENARIVYDGGGSDMSQALAFLNHPVPYCPPTMVKGSRPLYRRTEKSPIILITDQYPSFEDNKALSGFGNELIKLELS